jgi:CRISPR-associated protein Csn2
MKLAFPDIKTVLTFEENVVTALIVEHQGLFRKIMSDLSVQVGGEDGESVFSIANTPKPFKGHVELVQQWMPFDLNTKTLQAALLKAVEKEALSRNNFQRTNAILENIKHQIREWALIVPHEVELNALTVTTLLKASGLGFAQVQTHFQEQILTYVRLVRELIGEKLFIFVNLRSYLMDEEIEKLTTDLCGEKFKFLLLDSSMRKRLARERRLIVDCDYCEIGWDDLAE